MAKKHDFYRWTWLSVSILLLFSLLFSPISSPAVQAAEGPTWLPARSGASEAAPQAAALGASAEQIDLSFTFSGVQAEVVQISGQSYTRLAGQGLGHSARPGQPDLPFLARDVQIPLGATYTLEITRADYREVKLAGLGLPDLVAPAQVMQSKSGPVPPVAAPDAAAYENDAFQPAGPAALGGEYMLRGRRGLEIQLQPVLYNPVRGLLRIYSHLEVTIHLQMADLVLTRQTAARYASPEFEALQAATFLNYGLTGAEATAPAKVAPGYLIITVDAYAAGLAPFVTLKQAQGFEVSLVRLSETGTTNTAVKAYVQNYYNTHPSLAYLLLVGDLNNGTDSLTSWNGLSTIGSHITDLYFATLSGSDSVPDIGYGRFPVRNTTQLANMVNKAVAYEALTGSEVWIKKAAFLASSDPTYGKFAEETHNYVINTYTAPQGYTGFFPANPQPGGDQLYAITNNANTANVLNSLNDGRSLVIYSGHGSDTAWAGPGLSQTNVRNLTSTGVYAYVAGHACMTGRWYTTESFAETWVTQADKGALVYLGASDYTYWDQDDTLERRMFDALFAVDEPSIAAMLQYGNNTVEDTYGSNWGLYYREEYHIFGDPSVKLILQSRPADFTLAANPTQVNVCSIGQSLGETVIVNLELNSQNGFNSPVDLDLLDKPENILAGFNLNPVTPPGLSQLALVGNNAAPGNYSLTVQGSSGSLVHTVPLGLTVYPQVDAPGLLAPAPGAVEQPLRPTFTWSVVSGATLYTLEIAEDEAFSLKPIFTASTTGTSYTPTVDLPGGTQLYWRVVASNVCKNVSTVFAFTTLTPILFYLPIISR